MKLGHTVFASIGLTGDMRILADNKHPDIAVDFDTAQVVAIAALGQAASLKLIADSLQRISYCAEMIQLNDRDR